MIFKRIIRYVGIMAVLFLILSIISVARNWDYMMNYFSNSLYSVGGVVLYLLIYAVGFFLLFRAIFKR